MNVNVAENWPHHLKPCRASVTAVSNNPSIITSHFARHSHLIPEKTTKFSVLWYVNPTVYAVLPYFPYKHFATFAEICQSCMTKEQLSLLLPYSSLQAFFNFSVLEVWKRKKKEKKEGGKFILGYFLHVGTLSTALPNTQRYVNPPELHPQSTAFFFNNIIFLMLFTFIPSWTSPQLSSIEGRPTPAQTPPVSSNAQFTFPQAARCHI